MSKFIQVNLGIISLLAIFYTYDHLIRSWENAQIFLIMYSISLTIYYLSQFSLRRFEQLRKRHLLQILLLYIAGILIGLLMTCFSYGFNGTSVVTALRINLLASPLFILILIYWKKMTKQLNDDLAEAQDYLNALDD